MSGSKIGGIIRAVAAPLIAYAAAKGWITDDETGELLITGLAALATAAWSIYSKRR